MSDISKLVEAMNIVNKNKVDNEKLISEKIKLMRSVDLSAEALKQENIEDLISDLSDEEKKQFDVDVKNLSESYSNILDSVADYLENPELRSKIVDEFKRRLG